VQPVNCFRDQPPCSVQSAARSYAIARRRRHHPHTRRVVGYHDGISASPHLPSPLEQIDRNPRRSGSGTPTK
jgi:hypothetical protein